MIKPDEFYDRVGRHMTRELSTTGAMENAYWQHIGHVINKKNKYVGYLYDNVFENLDRMISGKFGSRWDGQNKKTDKEKLRELGEVNE